MSEHIGPFEGSARAPCTTRAGRGAGGQGGPRLYRKKPVVITAQQWFPPGDERHDPAMLATYGPGDLPQDGDLYVAVKGGIPNDVYHVRTLEGSLRVSPGDWIITGVRGERYPVKPEIFDATYEPVSEEART